MSVDLDKCTDKELDELIEDLRKRISGHDSMKHDGEMMLKNAVLMNAYTAEKQKRNTVKSGVQSMKIAYIALAISISSLCFSYYQSKQEITINSSQLGELINAIK